MGHWAWGIGHGAWGIGHGALGMGHGALGIGHWAWGRGERFVATLLPCCFSIEDSGVNCIETCI